MDISTSGYHYRYPHPAVTTDNVIFGIDGKQLMVLLVVRGNEPCKGMLAFPGGFINENETTEQCAKRELMEETGFDTDCHKMFGVYSATHRDPRERVITVAYYALVYCGEVHGGDDAVDARWVPVNEIGTLAFDHNAIFNDALSALRRDILFSPLAFDLLPPHFSMSQLQSLYEVVLGKSFNWYNYLKMLMRNDIIFKVETHEHSVDNALFAFDRQKFLAFFNFYS